jgi:hypothetical protein
MHYCEELLKTMKTIGALALTTIAAPIITLAFGAAYTAPVQAQAAYGSYIGIGPAIGLTKSDAPGGERKLSGLVSARYKFLELPISVRAQAFLGDGVAIMPSVSYDIPLNWQTEAYVGLGPAIHISGDTPIGDKTAFAIQPGIDYALPNSKVVLFGNAVIAFDAYKSGGAAASLQGGVGWRF